MSAQPCATACLFWYGPGAFGKHWCEVQDQRPSGPCSTALPIMRRVVRGLPDVREVRS